MAERLASVKLQAVDGTSVGCIAVALSTTVAQLKGQFLLDSSPGSVNHILLGDQLLNEETTLQQNGVETDTISTLVKASDTYMCVVAMGQKSGARSYDKWIHETVITGSNAESYANHPSSSKPGLRSAAWAMHV